MTNKDLKLLRGQIRQIVKELLPEIIKMQLVEEVGHVLGQQLSERLNKIDERQKNLQSYMIRTSDIRPKQE